MDMSYVLSKSIVVGLWLRNMFIFYVNMYTLEYLRRIRIIALDVVRSRSNVSSTVVSCLKAMKVRPSLMSIRIRRSYVDNFCKQPSLCSRGMRCWFDRLQFYQRYLHYTLTISFHRRPVIASRPAQIIWKKRSENQPSLLRTVGTGKITPNVTGQNRMQPVHNSNRRQNRKRNCRVINGSNQNHV